MTTLQAALSRVLHVSELVYTLHPAMYFYVCTHVSVWVCTLVTLKPLSCEALTWDNKAAVGISVSPINPLALILPQMKSHHLATGEEILLQLIKLKVAVAAKYSTIVVLREKMACRKTLG